MSGRSSLRVWRSVRCSIMVLAAVGCSSPPAPSGAPTPSAPGPAATAPDARAVTSRVHRAFTRDTDGTLQGSGGAYRSRLMHQELTVTPLAGGDAGHSLSLRTTSIRCGARELAGAPGRAELAAGVAAIARGAAREEVENEEAGVEQRWRFDAPPSKACALEVRVAASGARFSGETDGGLHFREPGDRVGLRYGHGTWVDAAGRRTAVRARFEAGSISLRVPREVLAGTRWPAVLDPVVGPETATDQPVFGPTSGSDQSLPSVASDGSGYLVVWKDTRDYSGSNHGVLRGIWAARVNAAGQVLDPGGIQVAPDGGGAGLGPVGAPAVAFFGTQYLVVWRVAQTLYGRRMNPAGTFVDATPFQVASASDGDPRIIAGGAGWLVTWRQAASDISAVFVSAAGVAQPPIVVHADSRQDHEPEAAWNGTSFLVTWWSQDADNQIQAALLSPAGVPSAPVVVRQSDATITQVYNPVVASDGSGWLISWHESGPGIDRNVATRLDAGGLVVDATPFITRNGTGRADAYVLLYDDPRYLLVGTSTTSGILATPIALDGTVGSTFTLPNAGSTSRSDFRLAGAWNGTDVLVAWPNTDIYATRISPTAVLDPAPFLVGSESNAQISPSVAWNGTHHLVTWCDFRGQALTSAIPDKVAVSIRGVRVAADGAVVDATSILITADADARRSCDGLRVKASASDGTGWLVAWASTAPSPGSAGISVARVAADGTVLDPAGLTIVSKIATSSKDCSLPQVAWDGANYLVVFEDRRSGNLDIRASQVTQAGAVIGTINVATQPGDEYQPMVASNGNGTLVTWRAPNARAARLSQAGVVLDATPLLDVPSSEAGGVTSDGQDYLLTYYASDAVVATRVTAAGVVLDGAPLQLLPGYLFPGATTFDGVHYVAVASNAVAPGQVAGARVTPAGVRMDTSGSAAAPFTIGDQVNQTGTYGYYLAPAIAGSGGGKSLVAYMSDPVQSPLYGYRMRLRTLRQVPQGQSCAANTDCVTNFCADGVCCDVACGGTDTTDCQACSVAAGAMVDGTCATRAAGQSCRAGAGACDLAEVCDGAATACPADAVASVGTTCRSAAGDCDVAETCDGAAKTCPADALVAAATVCRPAAGGCDLAEACTGADPSCPVDALVAAATECRAAAGPCDVAEACTGFGAACPADAFQAVTTTCRPAAGPCDMAEACTGSAAACPPDLFVAATTTCRAAAGPCDMAEACTGSAAACPADLFVAAATTCRAAAGNCDVAEACTGSAAACPADALQPAGTTCRATAGACDVAEVCSGTVATCPADALRPAGTECRAVAGDCDVAEVCSGTVATCPVDAFQAATTTCRTAAGACDVVETCPGNAATCPVDAFLPAATTCRAAAGACDVAELCTGGSASCPADVLLGAATVCRVAAGPCDREERCSGSGVACPADALEPATTVCRASAGPCDVVETCSGSDSSCPTDTFAPATTRCRAVAGPCDVAETCTGNAAACPADALRPSGSECRAATGRCDVAEVCNGSASTCPTDRFVQAGTACSDDSPCTSGDACD